MSCKALPEMARVNQKLAKLEVPWIEMAKARASFIQGFQEYRSLHEDPRETSDLMIHILKNYSNTIQDRACLFPSLANLTGEIDMPDTKRQHGDINAVLKQAHETLKEAKEIHERGKHGLGAKDRENFAKLEVELKHRLFDIESLTNEMIEDDFEFRTELVNALKIIIGTMSETLSESTNETCFVINEILEQPERQSIEFIDTETIDELKNELESLNSVNV